MRQSIMNGDTKLTRYHREVYKARNRATGQVVALKKVMMENEKEGVSIAAVLSVIRVLLSPSSPAVSHDSSEGDTSSAAPQTRQHRQPY